MSTGPARDVAESSRMSPEHLRYRADIDGLRAIAVLSVVGYHASPSWVKGGFIGVDVFFVISGFLISTIIFSGLDRGVFSYRQFYRQRVRRIFPALILVLAAYLAFGRFQLAAADYRMLAKHVLAGVGFVSNFTLWNESGYFDAASEVKPLLHLWSLGIEEQFYILWPFLLGIVARRRGNFLVIVAAIGGVSFVANIMSFPDHAVAGFYSPLARFWELMIGGCMAHMALYNPAALKRYSNVQAILGAALLGSGLALISVDLFFPSWWALLPTVGSALLIGAGPAAWINRTLLAHPVGVWFGKISYPLYLWHWPLLTAAITLNDFQMPSIAVRGMTVALSVALAWLTYRLVEIPIRFRKWLTTRGLIGGFCTTGMVAGVIFAMDGLPSRSINRDEARAFVAAYRDFYVNGRTEEYYRQSCNFYDEQAGRPKDALPASCTQVSGDRPVYLLWGDSHAQALWYGFRTTISPGIQPVLIATSACRPTLHDDPRNGAGVSPAACRSSNRLAADFIVMHRPARVFVTQRKDYETTDWDEMARFVRANGGELIVIGPTPQWAPSLAGVVARNLKASRDVVHDGLVAEIFATDEKMRQTTGNPDFRYVSLIGALCSPDGCIATVDVPDVPDKHDLLVIDYGHLSPAGSAYVARTVLRRLLQTSSPH
jgi:peptidoglycan/LPS O-acetylase OafA/YrhL